MAKSKAKKKTLKITREKFVREWCKDLESGKYRQGKACLYHRGRYCCLGVACNTANRLGIDNDDIDKQEGVPSSWFTRIMRTGEYGPVLKAKTKEHHAIDCVEANDTFGWSFKQIAAALRKKYLTKPKGAPNASE